jgi:hypothetical protein
LSKGKSAGSCRIARGYLESSPLAGGAPLLHARLDNTERMTKLSASFFREAASQSSMV